MIALWCGIGLVSGFQLPVPGEPVACGFGASCGEPGVHIGIDQEASGPVTAVCRGRVRFVDESRVILECQLRRQCISAVVAGFKPQVFVGDRVTMGQQIGWSNGRVHLGVRRGPYQRFVYPGCRDQYWNELERYAARASVCIQQMLQDMLDPLSLIGLGNSYSGNMQ